MTEHDATTENNAMSPVKWLLVCLLLLSTVGCGDEQRLADTPNADAKSRLPDGAAERPLRVMLIPADGGTEQGTIADFEPIFAAITREYGLHFEIRVGQAYNAVVEGMANGKVDIAFFGPVTYHLARERGAAQLLAVAVSDGQSVYYSGIFANKAAGLNEIADLRGKSVAFGDVNSTSSFNFPVAMMLGAGVDPVRDLGEIYLTGSHANALAALAAGKVDAACASYSSFEKSVGNGQIDPTKTQPLAKSDPIPYPPLAMHVDLADDLKEKLQEALSRVHEADGVTPDMIRGYGGKKVDRYDTNFSETEFDKAMSKLAKVTDALKAEMLKKAAEK
jgi:phosphonate transport system substrate-binding protein